MKVRLFVGVVCMLVMFAVGAFGQAGGPVVTMDENGNGHVNGTLLPSFGGGTNGPLTYILPFTIVPGDIVLTEPDSSGHLVLSELLRGFNNGNNGFIQFFSDLPQTATEVPQLADIGFPTDIDPNAQVFAESTTGDTTFTVTGPIFPVTYVIQSDPSEVPEPSTIALVGFGLLGLGLSRNCRKK